MGWGTKYPPGGALFGCNVGQAKDFTGKVGQALGLGALWGLRPRRVVLGIGG
jgi:hypothetical protein